MSRIHFFGASCLRDHGDGVVMEAPLEVRWSGGPVVHGCGRSKIADFLYMMDLFIRV